MTQIDYDIVKKHMDKYAIGHDLTHSEVLLLQDFINNVFPSAMIDNGDKNE